MITTADRVLSVLKLFSMERPRWSVEEAANELGIRISTAYRYFRSLASAGLIVSCGQGSYVIGPAVIELDRQTRHLDPLIRAARPHLEVLQALAGGDAVGLLCRLYGTRVICVDQCRLMSGPVISYERGRPMPLFRGSASKAILAYLPWRTLRKLHLENDAAIAAAGLGESWEAFRRHLRGIRRQGICMTAGEVDPGVVGLSSPVFAPEGDVLASIGLVIPAESPALAGRPALDVAVTDAARAVSEALAAPAI